MLVVPRAGVQQAVAPIPELSDVLVTAFAARRQLLMLAAAATLTLIGPETSPSLERLQELTTRNRIPYRFLVEIPDNLRRRLDRDLLAGYHGTGCVEAGDLGYRELFAKGWIDRTASYGAGGRGVPVN